MRLLTRDLPEILINNQRKGKFTTDSLKVLAFVRRVKTPAVREFHAKVISYSGESLGARIEKQ